MKLFFEKGKLFYIEYMFRLFWALLFRKADILNANDLDTLLPNYWVARIKGVRLIFDSHELFTEVPELIERPQTRAVWLRLEQWLFPKLQTAYTVNPSLARIFTEKYKVPVQVIQNLPLPKTPPLNTKDINQKILLYQGSLNIGRGIELMIQTMHHLPQEIHLWIAGGGDIEGELKQLVQQEKLMTRVTFKGLIPFESLHLVTQQASIGFSLEEDRGANYHYASPNKVVDYVQSHVPCIVADLPEMRRVVEQYHIGDILPNSNRTPQQLANKVLTLLEPSVYQEKVAACKVAAQVLNWEIERKKLLQIYAEG